MGRLACTTAALLLAACGGGSDGGVASGTIDEFCEDWKQGKAALGGFQPETQDDFETLRDAVAAITYPEGLTDEAETLVAGLDDLAGDLEGLDPGSAEFEEVVAGAETELTDAVEATNRIETFAEEEC